MFSFQTLTGVRVPGRDHPPVAGAGQRAEQVPPQRQAGPGPGNEEQEGSVLPGDCFAFVCVTPVSLRSSSPDTKTL